MASNEIGHSVTHFRSTTPSARSLVQPARERIAKQKRAGNALRIVPYRLAVPVEHAPARINPCQTVRSPSLGHLPTTTSASAASYRRPSRGPKWGGRGTHSGSAGRYTSWVVSDRRSLQPHSEYHQFSARFQIYLRRGVIF